jgi:hypothetical protein
MPVDPTIKPDDFEPTASRAIYTMLEQYYCYRRS